LRGGRGLGGWWKGVRRSCVNGGMNVVMVRVLYERK
jgi:hypothetical protein